MASNSGSIVKKAIQIDATNSVRTVKQLKQEISDLRDELLNLDKGTQEYEETQKQLQQDVQDLNEVMSAHKDSAKALEGSYNDLQNQLKELRAAWKETNDEVERNEIGEKIKSINDQLKDMDASIGDFHRNVGNYSSAWEGLTGVMDKGEKITDDLEKGIKAFGSAIGLTDKEVNSLSKSLKAMKDGFKIAKDIARAREESIKLAAAEQQAAVGGKAMATSQTAAGAAAGTMAVAEGTATVATKSLSVAMKGLRTALISTGIGVLIVALGELIGLLDRAFQKAKSSRNELKSWGTWMGDQYETISEDHKEREHELEFQARLSRARNEDEEQVLKKRKEGLEILKAETEEWRKQTKEKKDQAEQRAGRRINKREQEELDAFDKALEKMDEDIKNYEESIRDITEDIEVYRVEQANAKKETSKATNELRKFADVVKDPKFREAWKSIFSITVTEDKSPLDVLEEEYIKALLLANTWKMETTEIDAFFKEMIEDAKGTFQDILDMENKIYEEGLTPIQRLEQEKAEWLKKYEAWGQDAFNVTRYYDKKIQEERDRANAEAIQKQKEAEEKAMAELQNFLSQIDTTLNTEEKLHEMFLPVFAGRTITDEIQYDIDNLQTLYDAQMEYLNGLLETADLTEEEYAAVEDRILSLTVTFNNQMNALKGELDIQGQNVKIFGKEIRGMSKKWIASMSLMEDATASFSDTFQSLGLEDSVAFKGFATAQALISAILAANRVLAEEPGGAIIKGIAAAATLAAGLANVYAIWAVNPDGSNAGNANPQMNVGTNATPVIGNSTPINYTRNITSAAEMDEMNQPIFVKVTDIMDGIDDHNVQVTNASF